MKILKKFQRRFFLFKSRLLFRYSLHERGGSKHIVLPIKFKPLIKKLKLYITVLSLASAYFVFETLYHAFMFGLIAWLLGSLLERILFSYETIFVHPFPSFKWDPERWIAMAFGYGEIPDSPHKIPFVAMLFDDKDYGKKVYNLILDWTGQKLDDTQALVSASVTILEDNDYIFYIYPSPKRDEKIEAYGELKSSFHDKFPDRVHMKTHLALHIGKRFSITKNSFLPAFRNMYRDGVPILLRIGFMETVSSPVEPIEDCSDLIIYDFKIRNEGQLTRKDMEWSLMATLS